MSLLGAVVWPADAGSQNVRAASVSGRVLAGDTGKPIRGAIVNLVDTRASNPTQRQGRWIATDANGRWEFRDVAPGRYTVSASKTGYLKIEYGQRRPFEPGKILELSAGQVIENLDLTLPRGGAITGRIFDDFGDAAAGVMVRALRRRYVDGQRQLTPLSEGIAVLADGSGDLTDDLGHYRIYGLAPGDYYVSALFSPSGVAAGRTGYLPTYYPGTTSSTDARRITVRLGEEAQNINLNLVTARHAVISGVLDSQGRPVHVDLNLSTDDPSGLPLATGAGAADGTFTIREVPPGEHRLRVWSRSPAATQEFGSTTIIVGEQDVAGLVVVTAPGATATGRVLFEDGGKTAGRLIVRATPMVPNATVVSAPVLVNADMTFSTPRLIERQTFAVTTAPDG